MTIRTQEALSGFIAADPQLSFTSKGEARFYARVGQEHYERQEDGSFTQTETTFHDLVMYRRSAEKAFAQFAKGDHFVSEGYVHTYSYERDGRTIAGEEFVAKRVGHDAARSTYAVDRARKRSNALERPTPEPAASTQPAPPITL